jgi:hypothetical protein
MKRLCYFFFFFRFAWARSEPATLLTFLLLPFFSNLLAFLASFDDVVIGGSSTLDRINHLIMPQLQFGAGRVGLPEGNAIQVFVGVPDGI